MKQKLQLIPQKYRYHKTAAANSYMPQTWKAQGAKCPRNTHSFKTEREIENLNSAFTSYEIKQVIKKLSKQTKVQVNRRVNAYPQTLPKS